MPDITIEEALNDVNAVFIDVRSEKEFLEDHIPGAISAPILDNEERHIVGYTYKRESVEKAYKIGYEIFDKKISEFEKLIKKHEGKKIVFYCFRGGMRSSCFVDYFNKNGVLVYKLERGYKGYREYVRKKLSEFHLPQNIIVLYGLTGAGKTRIIKKLDNSIDLEGFASHKSSLFGGVGIMPNTQKYFESLLLFELEKKKANTLIFEGESRKIGNIIIPEKIFDAMTGVNSIKISITCSVDTRAKRIEEEYFETESKISEVRGIVPKLKEALGKEKVSELLTLLDAKDYFGFSKILLEEYYDSRYTHAVRDFTFAKEISSEDIDSAVNEINDFVKSLKTNKAL